MDDVPKFTEAADDTADLFKSTKSAQRLMWPTFRTKSSKV